MSTTDAPAPVPVVERDQSRPARQPAKPADEPRSGEALIAAAAADRPLSEQEAEDLLGYFLENGELPGDSARVEVTVELGHGPARRKLKCTLRSIEYAEWQDGQERATSADGKFDTFTACSYHVARALVKPQLGPVVVAQQQEAKASQDGKIQGPGGRRIPAPADAADLLRRMFHAQPGALMDLSAKVIQLSKLGQGQNSVAELEVDAAKN